MRINTFDAFLNYMVSVLILDTFKYVTFQFTYDFLLHVWPNRFQCLLNHSTTVHLKCERKNMSENFIGEGCLLVRRSKFKELLNNVISKDISHQRIGWPNNFAEYQSLFSRSSSLQFLLNESAKTNKFLMTHSLPSSWNETHDIKLITKMSMLQPKRVISIQNSTDFLFLTWSHAGLVRILPCDLWGREVVN